MSKWTTKYKDALPDSAFMYVAPGGKKTRGRTRPLSKRHLPYRNHLGNVSIAHVRNALARLNQVKSLKGKTAARNKIRAKLNRLDAQYGGRRRNPENDMDDEQEVLEALAEATDMGDADDFIEASYSGIGGGTVYKGPGRSEWLVFEDSDDAERAAVEYVKEQLEDDPSMFTESWLSSFFKIYPTDARMIAQENADSLWGDLSDREVVERAGVEDELDDLESDRDEAEERLDEIDEIYEAALEIDATLSERREAKLDHEKEQLDGIVNSFDKDYDTLVSDAREAGAEDMADEEEKYILRDPMGWLDDMGYDLSDGVPNFVRIDYDAAAQDAVDTDGVAHFLSHYDGNEYDLDTGGIAFRTN
jgi:hypothetical protein